MRNHGDHDAMAYDGPNADIAHLCQICGAPMPREDAPESALTARTV